LQWRGCVEEPEGAALVCLLVNALVQVEVLGLRGDAPWRVVSGRSVQLGEDVVLGSSEFAAAVVVEDGEVAVAVEREDGCLLTVSCNLSGGAVFYTCLLEWPLSRVIRAGEEWVRMAFLSGIGRLDPDSAQAFFRDGDGVEVVAARYSCED
jgi:hypothetical protein